MQFLAARSLCTNFCKARYSIPLATCKHRLRRNLCTAPSWGGNDYFVYDNGKCTEYCTQRKVIYRGYIAYYVTFPGLVTRSEEGSTYGVSHTPSYRPHTTLIKENLKVKSNYVINYVTLFLRAYMGSHKGDFGISAKVQC